MTIVSWAQNPILVIKAPIVLEGYRSGLRVEGLGLLTKIS